MARHAAADAKTETGAETEAEVIALRCTWRTCRQPGPWTITAGKAGSGHYAQAGACDTHRAHVERRTRRYANGAPATIERVELEPEQPTLETVPLWLDGQ